MAENPSQMFNNPTTTNDEVYTDNVTVRNKHTSVASNSSFDLSEKEEEYRSLTSTTSYELNRSYPDLHLNLNDDVKDLKSKICLLEEKLIIAETEIENLLLENHSQAKIITDYKLRIDKLTHICTTTSTKKSEAKIKRKCLIRTKLDFKETQQSPIQQTGINKMPSDDTILEPNMIQDDIPQRATLEGSTHSEAMDSMTQGNLVFKKAHLNKLCIISDNNVNDVLEIAKNTFPNDKICHYCMPKAGIIGLIATLDIKLINYTLNDYCIIFLGEADFLVSKNYAELVDYIKCKLEKILHTNIIVCCPTFKLKSNTTLFNTRIEAFNRLLHLSNQIFKFAYTFDTNKQLEYSYEMFHKYTGKVNNAAIKNVFGNLKNYLELFKLSDYEHSCSNDNFNMMQGNEDSEKCRFKPGTIPYYFNIMNTNQYSTKVQNHSTVNNDTDFFRE